MSKQNKYNLPDIFIRAINTNKYTKGDADFSVTEIIDSPRISRMRHIYGDEIKKDYYDSIYPLLGTAIHSILEENKTDNDIAEERLYINVDGKTLSGQIDLQVKDGNGYHVYDFKTTSAISISYNPEGKDEWSNQLNCYATLVEESTGRDVKSIGVWAILRDWSKMNAEKRKNYPKAPVILINIPLWDRQERLDYIRTRVLKHSMVVDIDDESLLPECTKEERWGSDRTFAVFNYTKAGSERSRATRVFDDVNEAERFAKENGGPYRIETREGRNSRCESWCEFSEKCSQHLNNLKR
jgi:hypothetical protein